ncbi:MAG: OmpA family protein [Clostridium sp.]|nr:OmpA family protein [Prevotella sp.]MCM1428796.1 OmpA family protein [Clostridium sp.]MCM1475171.1 OmpA family protein [Muribaculaceae bacterium]
MKNLSKTLCKYFAAGVLASGLLVVSMPATAERKPDNTPVERVAELDDMSFIDMLHSVELGKGSATVQKFQDKEGRTRLLNGKYKSSGPCTVESYRNKEVLLLTIPASLLFGPNETKLSATAAEYLEPIKRYLRDPDMYRVLLVMHTDNTGSEEYRDILTEDRVDAVFDWFEASGANTSYLFSYAMSDEMPLVDNDSFEKREKNRRLEIYLMPGKKMADQAKSGRISF